LVGRKTAPPRNAGDRSRGVNLGNFQPPLLGRMQPAMTRTHGWYPQWAR
jgi:hypothetical protein